jgi:glycosyltransferase involved in cell wall biosynthesis
MEEVAKRLKMPLLIAKGFTHEEMNSKFYSKCNVFVSFPPVTAGFQASWLEAMAAGVPIVIGNRNAASEVQPFDKIPNGQEHNINLIVDKVKNAKKKDYIKWIKENDFSWKRHAKRLIEIFSKK